MRKPEGEYVPVVSRLPQALADEAEARRVEAERLAKIAADADRKAADAWKRDAEKRASAKAKAATKQSAEAPATDAEG